MVQVVAARAPLRAAGARPAESRRSMVAEEGLKPGISADEPRAVGRSALDRVRVGVSAATWILLALLIPLYLLGSRFWWSEVFSVWPAWFWLMGLVPLAIIADRRPARRWTWLLLGAQLVWALAASEAFLLLRRPLREPDLAPGSREGSLRIVSLNLGGSTSWSAKVLAEIRKREADVYCFQEAPDPGVLEGKRPVEAAFPGFHCIHAGDCALLSRFPIEPERLDLKAWGEQMARVKTPAGDIRILNVRMPLPALRLNLFSRQARAEMRLSHRERLASFGRLAEAVKKVGKDGPLILAGDFNTPIRSTLLRPVRALLTDAFRRAGSGWGNTMTHDFPVSRIDAILVSKEFRVLAAQSLPNGISDHRTVAAEALLEEDGPGD